MLFFALGIEAKCLALWKARPGDIFIKGAKGNAGNAPTELMYMT